MAKTHLHPKSSDFHQPKSGDISHFGKDHYEERSSKFAGLKKESLSERCVLLKPLLHLARPMPAPAELYQFSITYLRNNKRPKRPDFDLPVEAQKNFSYSKQPIRISEFAAKINDLVDLENMKKMTTTVITGWLLEKGFLELQVYPDENKTRLPTKKGEYIGLSTQIRTGQYGEYRTRGYHRHFLYQQSHW